MERQGKKQKINVAKVADFQIPTDATDWYELAEGAGLQATSLSDLAPEYLASGSEATDTQFISYHGYRRPLENADAFLSRRKEFGITDEIWEEAGRITANSGELTRFIDMLKHGALLEHINEHDSRWPGSWAIVKRFQENILSNTEEKRKATHSMDALQKQASTLRARFTKETDTEELAGAETSPAWGHSPEKAYQPSIQAKNEKGKVTFPDADDECIPNTFIELLLEQANMMLGCNLSEWTMDRVGLELTKAGKSRYMAMTDGALRPRTGLKMQAVVEVKKAIRYGIDKATTKQEFSEIVGLVKNGHPAPFNNHWLLVALDRHEVYLDLFDCHPNDVPGYKAYLRQKNEAGDHEPLVFLRGKYFGPWDIRNPTEMKRIVRIFVAITIVGNLAIAEDLCKHQKQKEKRTGA